VQANGHQQAVKDIEKQDMKTHYPECVAGHEINESALTDLFPDQIHKSQPKSDADNRRNKRSNDVRTCKSRQVV
jgi:hypothetical protein